MASNNRLLAVALWSCWAAPLRAQSTTTASGDVPIAYLSYGQIVARLQTLAAAAPGLVTLWNAQQRYGLQSPGTCHDAGGTETPCLHWFVTITEGLNSGSGGGNGSAVLPNSLSVRPQVFLSGNLHGDEQVGPMTLIHLLEHMVHTAQGGGNPWITHLVRTRLLVAIPMTNPLGYERREREENRMDPNRDFPYSQSPTLCMRTLTGRAVNEAFREHLFQVAITFHGGMQAIAYEWGAANHMGRPSNSESPDDSAQALLGTVMGNMAGRFQGQAYPVDRINSLVYPVAGGMEDWAYAGSWDSGAVRPCSPATYGGYPEERTRYNSAQLRSFNVLVEASDAKRPAERDLGSMSPSGEHALTVEGPGDGHVPRNMRLTYATIDLAAPYVLTTALEVGGEVGAGGRGRRVAARADGAPGPSSPSLPKGLGGEGEGEPGGAEEAAAPLSPSVASSADGTALAADGAALARPAAAAAAGAAAPPMPAAAPSASRGAPGAAEGEVLYGSVQGHLASASEARTRRAEAEAAALLRGEAVPDRRRLRPDVEEGEEARGPAPGGPGDPPPSPRAGVGGGVLGPSGSGEGHHHPHPHPRGLTSGGLGPGGSALPAYNVSIGDEPHSPARAVPYSGPGVCWDASGGAPGSTSPCTALLHQGGGFYDRVIALNATASHLGAGGDAAVSVRVGWDVGGAVTVDATALLVGTWDARVPPALLTQSSLNGPMDAPFAAVVATYGLSPPEAASFTRYVYQWQRFMQGKARTADLPPDVILRHSLPARGVTRWVFGSLGARVGGGVAPLPPPDLTHAPLVTRFGDCFVAPAPGSPPQAGGQPQAPKQPVSCLGLGTRRRRLRNRRRLQEQQPPAPGTPSLAVQAYLLLPYAAVDSNWGTQVLPDPGGTPPQSHVVNARLNPAWDEANNGYVVRGRYHAVAQPIFVAVVAAPGAGAGVPPAPVSGSPTPSPPPHSSGSSTGSPRPSATATGSSSQQPPAPSPEASVAGAAATGGPVASVAAAAGAPACNESLSAVSDAQSASSGDPTIPSLGVKASLLLAYTAAVTMSLVGLLAFVVIRWARQRGRDGSWDGAAGGASRGTGARGRRVAPGTAASGASATGLRSRRSGGGPTPTGAAPDDSSLEGPSGGVPSQGAAATTRPVAAVDSDDSDGGGGPGNDGEEEEGAEEGGEATGLVSRGGAAAQ